MSFHLMLSLDIFYGLYLAQSNDEDQDAYKGEAQKERSNSKLEVTWKEFVKKMVDTTPDPVVSCKNSEIFFIQKIIAL